MFLFTQLYTIVKKYIIALCYAFYTLADVKHMIMHYALLCADTYMRLHATNAGAFLLVY